MKLVRYLFILTILRCSINLSAMSMKGNIKDETGIPLIGATVQVVGENKGTITDFDGNFEIGDVAEDAWVEVSYAGFITRRFKATPSLYAVLQEDVKNLEEVIVIGYGTSKIKDLTAPIEMVKGDELLSVPTSGAMSALQGKMAGVNIVNSGVPGTGPSVNIRGLGSFGNTSPLYVVDGMFYDNIDFLNSADIEDLSVMKDASAAAIYGVRAANGVVIITTKKGKYNQKPEVTYDGYVGIQTVNHRLKMASSNQYAEMLLEANKGTKEENNIKSLFATSINNYGGSSDEATGVYNLAQNTDWYSELIRPAVITNHSLNINGGSEKATYGVGINYFYQNGIMNTKNDYDRINIHANVDYKPFKWLTVGVNNVFSNSNQQSPNNAAWQQAYNMPGIFPVYDKALDTSYTDQYASINNMPNSTVSNANLVNPVATARLYDSRTKSTQIMTNIYAQFNIWKDKITLRTSYGYDFAARHATLFIPKYKIAYNQQNNASSFRSEMAHYHKYVWDNTLTYRDEWGKHSFKLMLGYSMREDRSYSLYSTATNVPSQDNLKYIAQGNIEERSTNDASTRYRAQSYFGRINYGYDNRYLLMATFRRDGTSKYNQPWGTFPSVGLAWVMSEEPWLKNAKGVDFLKLRASWGLLGNGNNDANSGHAESTPIVAVFGNTIYTGYTNESSFSWLKWEMVNETNVGLEYGFLGNRLTGDIDWYYRLTKDAVISLPLPLVNTSTKGNWANILNMGIDFNLKWEHKVTRDWTYFIGGNFGWLHNEVKKLRDGNDETKGAKTYQKVGEKMNSFYGWKVIGVYQTQEECAADPIAVENKLEPGDFKYEDVNGDNKIDGKDFQVLGSYIPDITYGFNLGFRYKGLDFTAVFTGRAGCEMYNRKRTFRKTGSLYYNYDADLYNNRWKGYGTSNTHPSATGLNKTWNMPEDNITSFFIEKADYFRFQSVTLGYTFTNVGAGTYKMQSIRVALSAEKPYTWFKANAMTPELSDSEGWDTEVYPLTATYTFSVQLKF